MKLFASWRYVNSFTIPLVLKARENAYCPYSGYYVGAAILTQNGEIFSGCNVENSSYGGTNCAERVAIQKAVSEVGKVQIKKVMVVTNANPPWPPCGFCRQVIAEFALDGAIIYTANTDQEVLIYTFEELFPASFKLMK